MGQVVNKAQELGIAKLKGSGIDVKQAKQLGLEFLTGEKTKRLSKNFEPLASIKINYYGPDGKPISDLPQCEPFYRIRYLEVSTDFAAMTKKKPSRYVQEPNTAPVAYFPKNYDWKELVDDVDKPLIITEGEFKAIKACQEGFPTIGLGGVYNWKSTKLGIPWIRSLDLIKWPRRNVYICYDSDYKTNPMVCLAIQDLAEMLYKRGAFVQVVALPTLANMEKTGLDDYLMQKGAADAFTQKLHEASPIGIVDVLWSLNKRYVFIKDPTSIVDRETLKKYATDDFKNGIEATLDYDERELNNKGEIKTKSVSAAAAWLKWPLRAVANELAYRPGRERFLQEDNGQHQFNIWQGWGVERKKGDVSPFLELLDHLFIGAEPGAKEWFLKWCAFPLKYPGIKMFSSSVFHGIKHGTGKSLIGYTLGKIYGKNFTELSSVDLHSHFNGWAEGKQFAMGDDVTGSNKRADNDFLKKIITQKNIRINTKYIPDYVMTDCINYFFTTNHPDSFFLEDDDRRFFIHEVTVGPLPREFYMEYDLWMGHGAAHLFDYLLELDTSDFMAEDPAFVTHAKNRMIVTGQSDIATWVHALRESPQHYLKLGDIAIGKDLFTAKELLTLYDRLGERNLSANIMGKELKRAGFQQVAKGYPIETKSTEPNRFFAIRNQDHWLKASNRDCAAHIDGWAQKQSTKKY